VADGVLTLPQLRGPGWLRLFDDVYVDARVEVDHALRCAAAALVVTARAVVTGRSAACVRGIVLSEPSAPVQLLVPPGVRIRRSGITARQVILTPEEIVPDLPPVTSPSRTAWEIAREADTTEAVVALDVLLHRGYVTPATLTTLASRSPRSRAAGALALAATGAESPQETRLRLRLVEAGIPPPVTQYRVVVRDSFLGRLDLAWPSSRVGLEYDGRWHGDPLQLERDRTRLNGLAAAGWLIWHATAADLRSPARFARLAAQIRASLTRSSPE
jgi:hypothetical protein